MVNNYINLLFNIYWYFIKVSICIYNFFFIKMILPIIYIYNLCFGNDHTSYNILFIKDSRIVHKFKNFEYNDNINIKYNYIIYKKILDDKTLITFNDHIDDIQQIKQEILPCNFEFLIVVIKVEEKSYDITSILKNKKNYYYVVNNYLFNVSFMNWLFINHIKKNFLEYNIVILDNMANEIIINKTQSIRLHKTCYEIINND